MRFAPQVRPTTGAVLIRSLIVGAVYALAQVLVAALPGPLSRTSPRLDDALLGWLTGTLTCISLSPFIVRSTWARRDSVLAVWAAIALVRSLGTGIEGSFFRPADSNLVIMAGLADAAIGLLSAWLAVALLMPSQQQPPQQPAARRTLWGWTWRVLLVGLAYCVFYFVFGAANALLYTLPFYENNPQYGLALPPMGTILLAQLVRGPLFGLGALFIVRLAGMPRRQTSVWLGLLLFVLGGFGPYLEAMFRSMPLGFNLATLTELLAQNFSTGLVAAALYVPKGRPTL